MQSANQTISPQQVEMDKADVLPDLTIISIRDLLSVICGWATSTQSHIALQDCMSIAPLLNFSFPIHLLFPDFSFRNFSKIDLFPAFVVAGIRAAAIAPQMYVNQQPAHRPYGGGHPHHEQCLVPGGHQPQYNMSDQSPGTGPYCMSRTNTALTPGAGYSSSSGPGLYPHVNVDTVKQLAPGMMVTHLNAQALAVQYGRWIMLSNTVLVGQWKTLWKCYYYVCFFLDFYS